MALVYVALGSNLGDREGHINSACAELAELPDCSNLRCSSLYETDPMGPRDQPDYLNAVCVFDYLGTARQLLRMLKSIERAHGRVLADERWTARPLDLDILLFGDQYIRSNDLQIPHVGISDRSFVLWPLAELDRTLVIPGLGSVQELLERCQKFGICKFDRFVKRQ